MASLRHRGRSRFFLLVLLSAALPACRRGLPDAQSYGARLYIQRCSGCHAAYNPASMTGAMWQVQVEAMEARMQRAGLPRLTDTERQVILDYLEQHAQR
jgi:mono/diheme cytochrome c family protein